MFMMIHIALQELTVRCSEDEPCCGSAKFLIQTCVPSCKFASSINTVLFGVCREPVLFTYVSLQLCLRKSIGIGPMMFTCCFKISHLLQNRLSEGKFI